MRNCDECGSNHVKLRESSYSFNQQQYQCLQCGSWMQPDIEHNSMPESEPMGDEIYRARLAYTHRTTHVVSPDGHKQAEADGRNYVVLLDGERVLAVYRVRPCGRLKYMRRWPRKLAFADWETTPRNWAGYEITQTVYERDYA